MKTANPFALNRENSSDKIDFSCGLFSLSALTVRFLTKRYIGEYDHQAGKMSSGGKTLRKKFNFSSFQQIKYINMRFKWIQKQFWWRYGIRAW
jgi:hypothetical protein